MNLANLADHLRAHPGLTAKLDLAAVASTIGGDGDDAAFVALSDSLGLALCAEAVLPSFAGRDPRVAGIAGVVTVLNDLAATGSRPMALLNTVVAPSREQATAALEGLKAGADLYNVPILGGHTTVAPGEVVVSTFALGFAERPLKATNAKPGDQVVFVTCLDGEMIDSPDGSSFFSHLRGPRRYLAPNDLALLATAAEAGEVWAARDISMPGLVGSLLQFLEAAGGLGARLDLSLIPAPEGVPFERWLATFSSYGFLLVGDPAAICARFTAADLTAVPVATLDNTGRLELVLNSEAVTFWDLSATPLTGLSPAPN